MDQKRGGPLNYYAARCEDSGEVLILEANGLPLSKPKTRKKLTQELACLTWFDPRFATVIPWKVDPNLGLWQRHLQGIENVHRLLRSKAAGKTCWAISADADLDGKELELESVLERVYDSDAGTILSCLPGRQFGPLRPFQLPFHRKLPSL